MHNYNGRYSEFLSIKRLDIQFVVCVADDPLEMSSLVLSKTYLQCRLFVLLFVCVEVLRPSKPNGVMSSAVSLPNHTFTGQV